MLHPIQGPFWRPPLAPIEKHLDQLHNATLFNGLSDGDFSLLLGAMRHIELQPGQILFEEGRAGDSLAVVASGNLRVSVKKPVGAPSWVSEIRVGDVVGEMSCVDPAPRSATVSAVQSAEVYELSRTMLEGLHIHAPKVAIALVRGIIEQVTLRLRDTNSQIEQALSSLNIATENAGQGSNTSSPITADPSAQANHYGATLHLAELPSLGSLTTEDLALLQTVAPPQLYPAGANLCKEGQTGASCFLIAKGHVQVIKSIQSIERLLATLSPGALVGQMSLVDSSPRSATLRSAGDVVALELGRDVFENLLQANSPLAVRFQEQIAVAGIRQLRQANQRFAQLSDNPQDPRTGSIMGAVQRMRKQQQEESDEAAMHSVLTYMHTALNEWGLSMKDLDHIKVAKEDGKISNAEVSARKHRPK